MTQPDDGPGARPRGLRWGPRAAHPADEQNPSPTGGEPEPTPAEEQEAGATAARRGAQGRAAAATGAAEPAPPASETEREEGPRLEYVRPDVTLESVRALGLSANVWTLPPSVPAAGEEEAAAAPAPAELGVYRPVDRAVLSPVFSHDIEVHTDTGTVDFVVRRAYSYPSGPLPGDPGRVPPYIDPRRSVCWSLAAGAVTRCLRGGGYF